MTKKYRAIHTFSQEELKKMVREYPYLKHLRDAYAIKSSRTLKVYVASAYDTLLQAGYSLKMVEGEAKIALERANRLFKGGFELFSPVLTFGRLKISRDEAMKMCLNKLKQCDFLFIADTTKVTQSIGIIAEYEFALDNDKCIVFENLNLKKRFERVWHELIQ